jgi:hypothetical protein
MENETAACPTIQQSLSSDFGSFEGFNSRTQSAIAPNLTAQEVVDWDHDRQGEAEFWPAGDSPEVALLFKHRSRVTATELLELDRMLPELDDGSHTSLLRIHYAVNICGADLHTLTAAQVKANCLHIFFGSSFSELRRQVAYELFELYHPEATFDLLASSSDGLVFDVDGFLNSPSLWVEEVELADGVALLVAPR